MTSLPFEPTIVFVCCCTEKVGSVVAASTEAAPRIVSPFGVGVVVSPETPSNLIARSAANTLPRPVFGLAGEGGGVGGLPLLGGAVG